MIEIKKSIEQGFSGQPGGLYDILKQLQQFGIGIKGEVFFVDNNLGSDTPTAGKSWEFPFKTLSYAIGVSNTSIARGAAGWASRNSILIRADSMKEDLTVPPAKCDVIGCGSTDALHKTQIIGEHAWTGSGTLLSSGFYNLNFYNDDTSPIFTVATVSGLYFGDCTFRATSASTHAIKLTGGTSHDLIVKGCRFLVGTETVRDPFDTAAISIEGTTFLDMLIEDNFIEGDDGLKFLGDNLYNGLVNRNVIKAVVLCVDDDTNDVVITNNMLLSEADAATISNCMDYNAALACGNILTGDNETVSCPTLSDLITYTG